MNQLERMLFSGSLMTGLSSCVYDYSIVVNEEQQLYPPVIDEDTGFPQETQEDTSPPIKPEYCPWVDSFKQLTEANGTDIIWVIDKSGSMADDTARLMTGIETMMNALPASDWRLVMISTDEYGALTEDQFPLVPGDTVDDALTMYNYVQGQSGTEKGFESLYNYIDQNSYAQTWMRPDATLLTVFVSDEEDQSFYGLTDAEAINEFERWFDSLRYYKYVASIVNFPTADSLCNPSDTMAGDRYLAVTNYYYGVAIDICSEDWSAGVGQATEQISPIDSFTLKYMPLPETLTVLIDQVQVQRNNGINWSYDQGTNTVFFSSVPPGGSFVEVVYEIDSATYEDCPSGREKLTIPFKNPFLFGN